MKWKKKDTCKTVQDVIKRNTGKTYFTNTKYKIKNIDMVVKKLKEAKQNEQKVTIVGDYDVDGICSTSIMTLIMKHLNINYSIRLPKRMSEGFGLSPKIVDEIETDILITVDNGIAAIEAINNAKAKGMYVIVTDHHLPNKDDNGNIMYPNADIIIDPNAVVNSCDFVHYCGAGIALKIAEEIISDKQLLNICKAYAALATIADVVLLQDENHLIVKEGLDILNNHKDELNHGLIQLMEMAGYTSDNKINETTIGYKLGPMINAPGRLLDDGAKESLKLLASFNKPFSESQAIRINNFNEERKEKVEKAIELVDTQLKGKDIPSILFIHQDGIEEGIVGIIAGKVAEKYECPCIIVTSVENNILKGSARSCNNINIKEILDTVQNELNGDAFIKYGGHADAAGLSLKKENYEKVKQLLIKNTPIINNPNKDIIFYDLEIDAEDIPNFTEEIDKYAPFGNGNAQIIFKINNYVLEPNYNKNLYSLFNNDMGIRFQNKYAKAISFDMANKYKNMGEPKKIDIIGTLSYNYYKEYVSNQIEIIDFKSSENKKNTKNILNDIIVKGM